MSHLLLQKNRASKGNGSWKNYSKEKTAITFGEEYTTPIKPNQDFMQCGHYINVW